MAMVRLSVMPVALIGRLAVDERARGRRLGELPPLDALQRIVTAAEIMGCLGAKDENAERFYEKHDFITMDASSRLWRMFLPNELAQAGFRP